MMTIPMPGFFSAYVGLLASFLLAPVLQGQYTLSPGFNSYNLINDRGELVDTALNIGIFGEPGRFNRITYKGLDQMWAGGVFNEIENPPGLPSAQTGLNGISITFLDDRRLLLGYQIFNDGNRVEGQDQTGIGIFQDGQFSELDSGFRSTLGGDMNADGWVVGWRDKTGLGHKDTLGSVTAVPVVISPGGGVTEIPHPNGQAYGLQTGESARDVLYDNEAILTGVNEQGMAVGTGLEKDGDGGGFVSHTVRKFSFYLNVPDGTPTLIPTPWAGGGSMGGASDINDRGKSSVWTKDKRGSICRREITALVPGPTSFGKAAVPAPVMAAA